MTVLADPRPALAQPIAKPNAFVRRLATLAPLTMDDLLAVSRLTMHPRRVKTGVDLTRPETRLDHVVVVLDGYACRYKLRKDGRRQNLTCMVAGDLSDLDGVILGRTTCAIATLSACTVVEVSTKSLLDLIEHHPNVTRALRLAKLTDEAIAHQWIMQLGSYSASERLAHLFCELLFRLRVVGLIPDDNAFPLPLSQLALSDILGLSSVHVNRSLQKLRQDGMITLKAGVLHVLSLSRLMEHAEFTSDYIAGKAPR